MSKLSWQNFTLYFKNPALLISFVFMNMYYISTYLVNYNRHLFCQRLKISKNTKFQILTFLRPSHEILMEFWAPGSCAKKKSLARSRLTRKITSRHADSLKFPLQPYKRLSYCKFAKVFQCKTFVINDSLNFSLQNICTTWYWYCYWRSF